MAVFGIENAIYMLRSNGSKHWKIYEDKNKRANGAPVITSGDNDANLTLETSMSNAYNCFNRLTPGRYIVTGFNAYGSNKPNSDFEFEIGYPQQHGGSISGTNSLSSGEGRGGAISIAGFGSVTAENFDQAMDYKFKQLLAEQAKEAELKELKAQLAVYKKEAIENDLGFKKGLISIGSVLYPMVSKTPAFKEVMGHVGEFTKFSNAAIENEKSEEVTTVASISGTENEQERSEKALEFLAENNPSFVSDLEAMADLKKTNPEMFKEGVAMLKTMVD